MNLIQIQEHLKELPTSNVVSYANGSNPDVPPYLALAELQRRNNVQQSAQQATPPEMSVKDQVERKALEQSANQLMADQARQQQGGQQLAQELAQPREEIPENVPQPQQPESVPTYADGGIASVPVGDIFKFDGGGIVTFAGGGTDTVENPFYEKEEKRKEEPKAPRVKQEVRQPVKQGPDYLRMSVEEAMKEPTMPRSPIDILEERKKTSPVLQKPLGADYEEAIKRRSEQDIKDQEAFQQRQQDARKRNFWQSLIEAGEASRLGGGIGNVLGGFGRSYNAAQAAEDERTARQEALRRQQGLDMAKLNAEIQNLRRAEERGDIDAAARHEAEIAKIKQKLSETRAATFGQAATTQEQMRHARAMEDLQRQQIGASLGAASMYSKSQLAKDLEVVKQIYPELDPKQQLQKAFELGRGAQGEIAGAKIDAKIMEDIQKLPNVMLKRMEMSKEKDPARLQRLQDELQTIIQNEYNIRTKGTGGGITTLPQGGTQGSGQGWGKAEKVS